MRKAERFLKRFWRRLTFLLDFKTMWRWDFESCSRCGHCYSVAYMVRNEVWKRVADENEKLCLNCLFELARKKGVDIKREDFLLLELVPSFDYEGV